MIILVNNILCKEEKGSSLFNSVQYVTSAVCNIYVNAHKLIRIQLFCYGINKDLNKYM